MVTLKHDAQYWALLTNSKKKKKMTFMSVTILVAEIHNIFIRYRKIAKKNSTFIQNPPT